jgi:hypothetical protein
VLENLPDWAASIIAIAIGLGPRLAVLSARSIARLLYRVLGALSEGTPGPQRERAREEAVSVAASRG